MRTISKHTGRIEVKPALKTLDSIRVTIRSAWVSACKYDKVDPSELFVEFSDENPYIKFYEKALIEYQRTMAEYQSGGYIGLRLG